MKKYATSPMVFRMPEQMLEKVVKMADYNMISTSAICRQAVSQYIQNMEADTAADLPQINVVNG
jgi:predicted transcriptional regulator